jgi:hemerythrin superfamily protein
MNMDIIVRETQMKNFLKRRFSIKELLGVVDYIKEMIDHGVNKEDAIYDGVRDLIKSRKFDDIDEFGDDDDYWDSYLRYEKPLISYVKMKLGL